MLRVLPLRFTTAALLSTGRMSSIRSLTAFLPLPTLGTAIAPPAADTSSVIGNSTAATTTQVGLFVVGKYLGGAAIVISRSTGVGQGAGDQFVYGGGGVLISPASAPAPGAVSPAAGDVVEGIARGKSPRRRRRRPGVESVVGEFRDDRAAFGYENVEVRCLVVVHGCGADVFVQSSRRGRWGSGPRGGLSGVVDRGGSATRREFSVVGHGKAFGIDGGYRWGMGVQISIAVDGRGRDSSSSPLVGGGSTAAATALAPFFGAGGPSGAGAAGATSLAASFSERGEIAGGGVGSSRVSSVKSRISRRRRRRLRMLLRWWRMGVHHSRPALSGASDAVDVLRPGTLLRVEIAGVDAAVEGLLFGQFGSRGVHSTSSPSVRFRRGFLGLSRIVSIGNGKTSLRLLPIGMGVLIAGGGIHSAVMRQSRLDPGRFLGEPRLSQRTDRRGGIRGGDEGRFVASVKIFLGLADDVLRPALVVVVVVVIVSPMEAIDRPARHAVEGIDHIFFFLAGVIVVLRAFVQVGSDGGGARGGGADGSVAGMAVSPRTSSGRRKGLAGKDGLDGDGGGGVVTGTPPHGLLDVLLDEQKARGEDRPGRDEDGIGLRSRTSGCRHQGHSHGSEDEPRRRQEGGDPMTSPPTVGASVEPLHGKTCHVEVIRHAISPDDLEAIHPQRQEAENEIQKSQNRRGEGVRTERRLLQIRPLA
mmetsp:Transcript_3997/g.8595  ORF Transcript_3997/g.8595 Transcript_3997/m.8595 type:complete len:700 (+) Transcript_3997:332-2431(+)